MKTKKEGVSFVQYAERLSVSLLAEFGRNESLETMLAVIALTFANNGSFSKEEIRIARGKQIYHPSGIVDALFGSATSMTGTDVGTARTYMRTFDVNGKVHEAARKDEVLNGRALQLRSVESWMSDRQGEPEERIARVKSILDANRNFQEMIRGNFAAIDSRSYALQALSNDAHNLEKLPVEMHILQLAIANDPKAAVQEKGKGIISVGEIAVIRMLSGKDEFVLRDNQGKVVLSRDMNYMQSSALLLQLPEKISQAQKNFGPKW